jgi:hypothetical protein
MKNLLIDAVLAQMQKDFESGDMTAIEELLRSAPYENLVGYLSEETINEINDTPIGLIEVGHTFPDDGMTEFFIDDRRVSCEEFNNYFDKYDTGWQESINQQGKLVLTIFTDDRG